MDSDDPGINNSRKHYHSGYEEARLETMLNDLRQNRSQREQTPNRNCSLQSTEFLEFQESTF